MDSSVSSRSRNRATTACTSCRRSRIRCVTGPEQRICRYCQKHGLECVFDEKDGRKCRYASKALRRDLNQRIEYLESLLKEQNRTTGQSDLTASSQNKPHTTEDDPCPSQQTVHPVLDEHVLSPSLHELTDQDGLLSNGSEDSPEVQTQTALRKLVLSPVQFDMASGRVRFFGLTTNMHVKCVANMNASETDGGSAHWPIAILLPDLSPATHDYLMELYWKCHNWILHLVHMDAFFEDQKSGRTQFYSLFLHVCILAMGVRYADKSRPDIQKLVSKGPETSVIHVKAKKMAEFELQTPGGIPAIQALFLLGDLECGSGRDDTGWLFAGMSFRLVFDVGLHVDPSELHLTEKEVQIRHMVLWACIVNDKYWSLYLGRPTSIKSSDIAPSCLIKDFGRLLSCRPSGHAKTYETRIYEALLKLMDVIGTLCETLSFKKCVSASDSYFKIAAMDRQLLDWYADISDDLKWTTANISKGPASFFLIHSQYHAALILLHRNLVRYDPIQRQSNDSGLETERNNHFSAMSRTVCIENAVKIATIFKHYQEKFDLKQVFMTGLQHVGTAITALMAEVSVMENSKERRELLGHLHSLGNTLSTMAMTYQPAIQMLNVLGHFLKCSNETETTAMLYNERINSRDKNAETAQRGQRVDQLCPMNSGKRVGAIYDTYGVQNTNMRTRTDNMHSIQNRSGPAFESTGLPFLPSSWLEGLNWEDTEIMNLMGLEDLQYSAFSESFDTSGIFPGTIDEDLGFSGT